MVTSNSFKIIMQFVVKHFQDIDIYPVLLRHIPIAPGGLHSLIVIPLNAPELYLQCEAMGLLSYFGFIFLLLNHVINVTSSNCE